MIARITRSIHPSIHPSIHRFKLCLDDDAPIERRRFESFLRSARPSRVAVESRRRSFSRKRKRHTLPLIITRTRARYTSRGVTPIDRSSHPLRPFRVVQSVPGARYPFFEISSRSSHHFTTRERSTRARWRSHRARPRTRSTRALSRVGLPFLVVERPRRRDRRRRSHSRGRMTPSTSTRGLARRRVAPRDRSSVRAFTTIRTMRRRRRRRRREARRARRARLARARDARAAQCDRQRMKRDERGTGRMR